jgi:hypothetical protein
MSPGPATADNLRARAVALRAAATKLDHCAALDLYQRAGSDVWEGATPRRCREDLLDARSRLLRAVDDLRHIARVLDERALHAATARSSSS